MDYGKSIVRVAAVVVALLTCFRGAPSYGSGYGIFTHGASALGQAAAVVAHNDDPSTLFYNPALLNDLPGTQVSLGTTLIFPDREFRSDATGTTTSTEDTVFYPSTIYLTHTINDSFSAGLGVFNPFGLTTTWPSDWEGRYIATKSDLTTFNINPVISCRVTPEVSVAAGLDIILLDATLESKVPSVLLGIPGPSFDVRQRFTGSGTGVGFNAGLRFAPCKDLSIGASYRSEVNLDIDGDVSFDIPIPASSAKSSLTLPQQVSAGIAYRPTDRLAMEAGMRWEDWASFKHLLVEVAGTPPLVSITPRDWHGTYAINGGGSYRLNDTVTLLAGYLYGWNPVPDSTFEPAIPDSNTHLFCAGTDLKFGSARLALSYAYQLQEQRTKNNQIGGGTANGSYDSGLHLVAVSLGYRF